nr:hypothetical protein [Paenibacillus sp. VTT E-133280]
MKRWKMRLAVNRDSGWNWLTRCCPLPVTRWRIIAPITFGCY